MVYCEAMADCGDWTCPACSRGFVPGEQAFICNECGGTYHVLCWDKAIPCRSCNSGDDALLAPDSGQPEITVYVHEARAAVPLPKSVPIRSAEEVAAEFAPKSSAVGNWLAAISILAAFFSLLVVPGFLASQPLLLGVGLVCAFLGGVIGIAAVMLNWSYRRLSLISVGALILSCAVIFFSALISSNFSGKYAPANGGLTTLDMTPPSDEHLAGLSIPIANALRANVIIEHAMFLSSRYGSGVVTRIGEGNVYILTNKHVLGEGKMTVHFQNGLSDEGQVRWRAPHDIDLAFISCKVQAGASYRAVSVYRGLASPGDVSFAVGNPMQLPWTYTTGVISSVRMQRNELFELHIYQTQTAINMGNSGGGLYSEGGELIGINTWTQSKAVSEGISFSITTKSLLDLLGSGDSQEFIEDVVSKGEGSEHSGRVL